ncbi:uncharacterized protein LOC119995869 [Tripterygium wilfordii]|uniref:uncharacterized protein LOC119995869 n=1 Tax=Tripterygium wilfordii TaxID=458696 RepID=UPI0018F85098|nr:uncharacterized protein LOC119995869 [Tripterygium wilfordii]
MAYTSSHGETEGLSMNRPPFFNGKDYGFWKTRMRIFLTSLDLDLWDVIENGPHCPMKKEGENLVKKDRSEWTSDEKKLVCLNAKAINVLHCAMSRSEFNHISTCKDAQEIWNMLELKHEGTSQVKDSKINMLVHQFEMFKMKNDEPVCDMFARLTSICNDLESLGKVFTNAKKVQKVLRSLPKTWRDKVTAIQEAKDLRTLKMEELIGSLMTHELDMMSREDEEELPKKKGIALKVDDKDSSNDEEEAALLAKHFRKFMKFKKQGGFKSKAHGKGRNKEDPTCFKCGKLGHMIANCPKASKTGFKGKAKVEKKAFKATWDESSDESSSDEEEEIKANLCLVAKEVKNSSPTDELVSDLENPSNDELSNAFDELYVQHENLLLKYKLIKKENSRLKKLEYAHTHEIEALCAKVIELEKENEVLEKHKCVESHVDSYTNLELKKLYEFDDLQARLHDLESELKSWDEHESVMLSNASSLQNELDELREKNKMLELQFSKFNMSSEKLNMLLSSQRHYLDRSGIGYDPMKLKESLNAGFSGTSKMGSTSRVAAHMPRNNGARISHSKPRRVHLRKFWVPKGINDVDMHAYIKNVYNVCLKSKSKTWYLDSGCSRHMTGDTTLFTSFIEKKNGGNVTFGDNSKSKILGIGSVGNNCFSIDNVLYVDGLSFNLISISQLVDKGYVVKFKGNKCLIKNNWKELVIVGYRSGNVYVLDLDSLCSENIPCLLASNESAMIWHRRHFSYFSAPRTPQQNGVVERKNRTLQELGRTMLIEYDLPKSFWAEAINNACYISNRLTIRKILNKTPYELLYGKKLMVDYFRVFGSKCYILNTKDNLDKFDAKSDVGIFLGYSTHSRAYRVFNSTSKRVEESIHVKFDDINSLDSNVHEKDRETGLEGLELPQSFLEVTQEIPQEEKTTDQKGIINKEASPTIQKDVPRDASDEQLMHDEDDVHNDQEDLSFQRYKVMRSHPKELIIGDLYDGRQPRAKKGSQRSISNPFNSFAMLSLIEPKFVKDALCDDNWVIAMQDELNQFERSKV